jgi:tetratricopeptide (TPR) repeat protein
MHSTPPAVDVMRTRARAQVATEAGAWADAARLWEEVVTANPVNGAWWHQLARAREQLDDTIGALAAWTEVFRLRDDSPGHTAVRIARCHALQGDDAAAMTWIGRAMDLAWHDLDALREEDAFARLHDDPAFRAHAGFPDDGLDRDGRWRADVRFAAREIRRRAFRPFETLTEAAFDAEVERIVDAVPGLTDMQVVLDLARLVRRLNDGHARVRVPEARDDLQHAIPLSLYLFEEGLFVIAAAPGHEALLGAEVLRFDGRDASDVIAAVEPLVPRDNDNAQWVRACLPAWLAHTASLHALGLVDAPDRIALTVRDVADEVRTATVDADPAWPARKLWDTLPFPVGWPTFHDTLDAPVPHYLRNVGLPFWFVDLPDERLVYVQFNAVRDTAGETMEAFGHRLYAFVAQRDIDRLVIDMRWNGGGNTLREWPLLRQVIADQGTNRRGSLFVIIGRGTFSAAQNGVNFLATHSEATFVGEPTGSSPSFIGETRHFTLPHSKVIMNVSDLHWVGTWPGDQRMWIPPEVYAPPTFAAFRENRDPALEAILALRERLPAR